jgi:outer membrane receptor protein involved in Fe transport
MLPFTALSRWFLSLFVVALFALNGHAQTPDPSAPRTRIISGLVRDNYSEPLPGTLVRLQGTNSAINTNLKGEYSIAIPADSTVTLEFAYVGYVTVPMKVDPNISTVDVKMSEASTSLQETVITATRQPVRKIETTTAVDFVQSKDIQERAPVTFADAIRYVPGIYTQTASGRYGGQIFIRGFPDGAGNGLVYTSLLVDGLPSFASPARPVDEFFKYDFNTERMEVVRGSAATLFGRAAAAGVINLISRTGGTELSGSAQLSHYSNVYGGSLNPRIDVNLNGPLLSNSLFMRSNLRFNIGGFYLHDSGFRNSGFADRGGQLRFNLDYFFNQTSSFRLFGMYTNTSSQNNTDIPYMLDTQKPAAGWSAEDTYYTPAFEGLQYRVTRPDNTTALRDAGNVFPTGNFARGYQIGFNLNLNIGNGFTLINRFRRQDISTGLKYSLGISSYYNLPSPSSTTALNTNQIRLLLDGEATNVDHINELRIQKTLQAGSVEHQFNLGNYFSTVKLNPEYYQYAYTPDLVPRGRQALYRFIPAGLARNGNYTEQTLSFFGGDEIKFNEQLTVNAGARYDIINLDLFDVMPPLTIAGRTRDPNLPTYVSNTRTVSISDWSASLGGNYLINKSTSVYLNMVRAFRAPDYSVFTQVRRVAVPATATINGVQTNIYTYSPTAPYSLFPNGITKNEAVFNIEAGYRSTVGAVTTDVAVFRTAIDNRLSSTYIDGQAVVLPLGNNLIVGGEATFSYMPRKVKGLTLRTSLTVQDARFVDYRIAASPAPITVITPAGSVTTAVLNTTGNLYGNTVITETASSGSKTAFLDLRDKKLPTIPGFIWNVQATYVRKAYSLDARLNYVGSRYQDPTNQIELKPQVFVEAGASATYKGVKLRVNVQNLLNENTLMRQLGNEGDQALIQRQVNPNFTNVVVPGLPMLPRRLITSVSYSF